MFCCEDYEMCQYGACIDCQILPNPHAHVDVVLTEKAVRKLEKIVDNWVVAAALKEYG
eukprot:COSAG02_NODE_59737_length_273_cov_0.862069_1_plen_57_part_01